MIRSHFRRSRLAPSRRLVSLAAFSTGAVLSGVAITPVRADVPARKAAPIAAPAAAVSVSMRDLIQRYTTDDNALERFYTLDFAEDKLARLETLHRETQAQLAKVDYAALPANDKIDYLLLRDHLDHERKQIAYQRERNRETARVVPFAPVVVTLEENRWRIVPLDPEQSARTLTELAQAVKRARAQVKPLTIKASSPGANTPNGNANADGTAVPAGILNANATTAASAPTGGANGNATAGKPTGEPTTATDSAGTVRISPVIANRAAAVLDDLRQTLQTWYGQYDTFRPDFAWWNKKPYDAVTKEIADYAAYLRMEIAGIKPGDDSVLIGDPIGHDALLDDLRHERIAYSPEELVTIAEKEMAWCEGEMRKAARDMGKGDDWKAALETVKQQHVPPGKQDEFIAQQARDVIAFVDKRDLVTIDPLCRETWRVQMIDAQTQKILPFAAYGGQRILVAYPTDAMEFDARMQSMRANNEAFTHIVTPHELIPGHHLQGFVAARNNPHRQLFSTPFLVEGWALYWERTLWRLGYGATPEQRIGMLFWRMHRCARIIVSLSFHLGKMTPNQMIDYLVTRVGHERDGATSEVRRYIGGQYSPLYQVAYMIGGMQIDALHHELVDGGKMSNRTFHDAVLREGPIPVDLIRAALTNAPPAPDAAPSWHFADEIEK